VLIFKTRDRDHDQKPQTYCIEGKQKKNNEAKFLIKKMSRYETEKNLKKKKPKIRSESTKVNPLTPRPWKSELDNLIEKKGEKKRTKTNYKKRQKHIGLNL
jgi:hypothetical protein